MNITGTILMKSLVKPFYKQNAGLFAFLFFIMVAAVGRANEAGLLEYHLSLIQAIMTNFPFLLFTLCAWFLYAVRCSQFIADTLEKRDYTFLSLISLKRQTDVYKKLLVVQVMILLPVLLYASIAVWIGVRHQWWPHVIIVSLFFLFLSFSGPLWYQFILCHPHKRRPFTFWKILSFPKYSSYWLFLVRYIRFSRKSLFLIIKIFSCLMLYGLISGESGDPSDLQMILLFYSFCLLGHGALIYTIREMEEIHLAFYRGLPVSLFRRFLQYSLLYFVLFIPEIMIIEWQTPKHVNYSDAILFVFYGYSVLLFLNSLLFIRFFRKFDYLKIVTGLFLILFIAILAGIFELLCAGLFLFSVYIFFRQYYRFEKIL